jgi:hypothetical protein
VGNSFREEIARLKGGFAEGGVGGVVSQSAE